jgi:hypothetical protein
LVDWASGTSVVVSGVSIRLDLNDLPEVGDVDHELVAEVEPDVVDVGGGAVEDEVSGL